MNGVWPRAKLSSSTGLFKRANFKMSLPMGRMRNISPKSPLINNANRCRSAISYSLLVATTQLPAAAEFFFRFFFLGGTSVWQAFYRENAIKNNAHKEAEKYQALFTGSVENYMFADFFQH